MLKQVKQLMMTAAFLGVMPMAYAVDSATFSPKQQVAIEKIVHQYLVAHPVVLLEAAQALQKQQQKDAQNQAQTGIKNNATALFNTPISPVIGNARGNVTIVEFFDFQCSVCQRVAPVLNNVMKSHADLRVVMKEWPIFGEASQYAAKAGLAAAKQGKFMPFYEALINNEKGSEGNLTTAQVDELAQSAGVNVDLMKKEMQDPVFNQELMNNLKLAESMRLAGTPAFVIAKTPNGVYKGGKVFFVPGGASEASFNQLIQEATA